MNRNITKVVSGQIKFIELICMKHKSIGGNKWQLVGISVSIAKH
jgi:hypothetical protein